MKKGYLVMLLLFTLVLLSACNVAEKDEASEREENGEKAQAKEKKNDVKPVTKNEGKQEAQVEMNGTTKKVSRNDIVSSLKENIAGIDNTFRNLGDKYGWHNTNPPEYEKISPHLTDYATSNFINTTLKETADDYYCGCDMIILPVRIHYDAQFKVNENDDGSLSVSALEPATDIDNMGSIWTIELKKSKDGNWLIDGWERESLNGKDVNLTKDQAEKIVAEYASGNFSFVRQYESGEGLGTIYIFKTNGILTGISSKSTKIIYENELEELAAEEAKSEQYSAIQYETYSNGRFGFEVDYPASFTIGDPPTNDDGRSFRNTDDGAEILVYGHYINIVQDNETIEYYYNLAIEEAGGSVSYQKLDNSWFVVSYKQGDKIIYKKAILVERVLSVLSIEYPINKKEYYDDMVTHLSKSFKGAVEGL